MTLNTGGALFKKSVWRLPLLRLKLFCGVAERCSREFWTLSNRPLQACELPAICLLASCLVERLQRPHWQSSLRVPAWCCHPQAHVPTQNQRVGALDRSCPWGGEQWREGGQDIGNILPHKMMSSQLKNTTLQSGLQNNPPKRRHLKFYNKKWGEMYFGLVLLNEIVSWEKVENPEIIISKICRYPAAKLPLIPDLI